MVQDMSGSLNWRDVILTLVFLLAAGVGSLLLSRLLPQSLYDDDAWDVWFDCDLNRSHEVMTSREADSRSKIHPVLAIVVYLPTKALIEVTGMEPLAAIRVVSAAAAAVWAGLMYLLLRAIGCRRLDASIFTGLSLSSASAICFFAAPETFLFASIFVVIALIWAVVDEGGEKSALTEAFISAGTFCMTVTNWMVGLLSSFLRRPLREAVQISTNALVITLVLWTVQKYYFARTEFFIFPDSGSGSERTSILSPEGGSTCDRLVSFFAHSMVLPEVQIVDRPSSGRWPLLLTQPSSLFSAGWPGNFATVLWICLLCTGIVALFTLKQHLRFRLLLAGVIVGQVALHIVYGEETFLYSLHWLPLLIALVALASLTKWRTPVLVAAGLFCVVAGINNLLQFRECVRFLADYEPTVKQHREAERREPQIGVPWTKKPIPIWGNRFRGYDPAAYEPGGGLWPAVDTFLVEFWAVDRSGKILATSHDYQMSDTGAAKTVLPDGTIEVSAATPYYRATWQCPEPRFWRLKLDVLERDDSLVCIALRGVGWDFSEIRSIKKLKSGLLVDSRWRVEIEPVGQDMWLGTEDQPGWTTDKSQLREIISTDGWAYARIGPIRPGKYEMTVVDERRSGSVDTLLGGLSYWSADSGEFSEVGHVH
jgi:hypothetical protein